MWTSRAPLDRIAPIGAALALSLTLNSRAAFCGARKFFTRQAVNGIDLNHRCPLRVRPVWLFLVTQQFSLWAPDLQAMPVDYVMIRPQRLGGFDCQFEGLKALHGMAAASRHAKRRELIKLLSGAAAWPLAARAQPGERMQRIFVLMATTENDVTGQAEIRVFRQSLQVLGWTEGPEYSDRLPVGRRQP